MATIRRSQQAGSVPCQSANGSRKRSRTRNKETLHKPHGVIHPRVQKVGPEHFGIVAVDCAKARSKWMFADYYGNVLVAPVEVEHNQLAFAAAMACLRDAIARHHIEDLVIAVNAALTNLDGLNGVTSIGGSLSVGGNAALTNLDGLDALTELGPELQVTDNTVLPTCEATLLEDRLVALGWDGGGGAYIWGNDDAGVCE